MNLHDLGERRIIERIVSGLAAPLQQVPAATVGIGDDCAALDIGDRYLLITTDLLVEKTDIPACMTPYQLGRFIVAINFSDIAACGGTPQYFVLSAGFPSQRDVAFLDAFTKGMNDCVTAYGAAVIGGDTNEADELILSGTAIGTVPKNQMIARHGARVNDIVAVTGAIGSAAAGYHCWKNGIDDSAVLAGLLMPTPRVPEARALAEAGAATAGMDNSDGLPRSLHQLAEASGVGFSIDRAALPLWRATHPFPEGVPALDDEAAVSFGGDYELIVTIAPEHSELAQHRVAALGNTTLTPIGRVVDARSGITISSGKETRPLADAGYEHFTGH